MRRERNVCLPTTRRSSLMARDLPLAAGGDKRPPIRSPRNAAAHAPFPTPMQPEPLLRSGPHERLELPRKQPRGVLGPRAPAPLRGLENAPELDRMTPVRKPVTDHQRERNPRSERQQRGGQIDPRPPPEKAD